MSGLQPVRPAESQWGFHRQLPLAIAASALLHAGVIGWWLSRPAIMPGSPGMQTVTVDLVAFESPASQAEPLKTEPLKTEPEVLPDGEGPPQHQLVPKPPVKKPSPGKRAVRVEQDGETAQPVAATVAPANVASPAPAQVTAARYDAAYLRNPAPVYPSSSRRLGEEGRVLLRVQVSAEGSAITVQVKQSSGFERLDTAARNAVAGWKFVPAYENGLAITSWVEVPLQFSLKK